MKTYDHLKITTMLCRIGVCAFASCYGVNAWAAPQDGNVAAGKAVITQNGKKTDIRQSSQRAVIDWRKFNIAPDEHPQFHQPNGSSVTLNRVGGDSASHIAGKLTANGHVVIVNPNGVLFGSTAQVDVNGLVASTSDIRNRIL